MKGKENMINKTTLMQDLERIGIDPKGTLWLHLSLKSLGTIDGGADCLIDALMEYMKDGLLVIPTHTWEHVNAKQPVYHINETPSCIGIVPELFRKRNQVHRSLHPTHSVAAYGKEAETFVSGQTAFNTPCHPDSNYGDLIRRKAQVLLIGVNFARNTLVHCIEEMMDVPKRLTTTTEKLLSVDHEATIHPCPQHRHIGAISENYPRMEDLMFKRAVMKEVKIGRAKTLAFNAADLEKVTLELLEDNIASFDNLVD